MRNPVFGRTCFIYSNRFANKCSYRLFVTTPTIRPSINVYLNLGSIKYLYIVATDFGRSTLLPIAAIVAAVAAAN